MGFKVGDRVCAIIDHPQENNFLFEGDTGTVVFIQKMFPHVGVMWDKQCGGHDCIGSCEEGYGWFVGEHDIMTTEAAEMEFEIKDDHAIKALFSF